MILGTRMRGLADGVHNVNVYVVNSFFAGPFHRSDSYATIFNIDTKVPQIFNISIENKTYNSTERVLSFCTNEVTQNSYSLDSQPIITFKENAALTSLSDGLHNLIVYANDTLGNMSKSEPIIFTVDTSTPSPTPSPTLPLSQTPTPSPSLPSSPTSTLEDTLSPTPNQTPDGPKIGDFAPVIIPASMILPVIVIMGLLVYFKKLRNRI